MKIFNCIINLFTKKDESTISIDDATFKNVDYYVPKITRGRVIKVYDGDTITVASHIPECNKKTYKFSIRLRGIDSPEIRSSSVFEKQNAMLSRDSLHEKIHNKYIDIKNVTTEKYGRLLADIYINGVNINEWMVENKLAVRYDGGKKNNTFIDNTFIGII
jgi:micrococcal nuclease